MFEHTNWIAESFGAIALVVNFVGYRQNKINHYRFVTAIALISISMHFYLLDAYAAAFGCGLASIRNIVAIYYRKLPALVFFVGLSLSFLVYEWLYLLSPWFIIIAYASSLIFTVGSIVFTNANQLRRWFVLAECLGLIYALLVGSIFGTIFNMSNICSILLMLNRHRRGKQT